MRAIRVPLCAWRKQSLTRRRIRRVCMAQALGQHEALDLLLCRAAGAGPADAAAVGRAPAEAIIPAQEISQVGAWRAAIRAPPDWADSRGSQRLGYAPRSAAPPAGTLELEHVHGYGGRVTRGTLCLTLERRLVYPAASVVVLLDSEHHRQSFFLGHTDLVNCLDAHPGGTLIASGELGRAAQILVWDSLSLAVLATLSGVHRVGVTDMKFSRDGNTLVSVDMADDYAICVWDWRKGRKVASAKGDSVPVTAVNINPDGGVVSVGDHHIKFWEIWGSTLRPTRGNFEHKGSLQAFFSVNFMELRVRGKMESCTVAGAEDGSIYVWRDSSLQTVEKRAHDGPVVMLHTPPAGVVGSDDDVIYSAGVDGKVRLWRAHQTGAGLRPVWTLSLKEKLASLATPFASEHVWVRGVAAGHGSLFIGSSHGEIYEFTAQEGHDPVLRGAVVLGHALGPVTGLDVHPARGEFVTVGHDNVLRWWSCEGEQPIRMLQLLEEASAELSALGEGFARVDELPEGEAVPLVTSAVAFSPDGDHVAVGWSGGELWVVDAAARFDSAFTRGAAGKLRKDAAGSEVRVMCGRQAVTALRYAPDGRTLVVGLAGGKLLILEVVDEATGHDSYRRVQALAQGHNADVSAIDFDSTGQRMQTSDAAKGLAYWEMTSAQAWVQIEAARYNELGDMLWEDVTGALGWAMQGVHPDAAHVEYGLPRVHLARHRAEVAAIDDAGRVVLHRYPCLPGAVGTVQPAHAGPAAAARFTFDDACLITAGGADRCVMRWRYRAAAALAAEANGAGDPGLAAIGRAQPGPKAQGVRVRVTLKAALKREAGERAAALREVLAAVREILRQAHPRDFADAQADIAGAALAGPPAVDIVLLPHASGWHVPPSPVQLAETLEASSLGPLYQCEPPARRLPWAQPDDDAAEPLAPWMGAIADPSDWDPQEKGSKHLGFLPADLAHARRLSVVPLTERPPPPAVLEDGEAEGVELERTAPEPAAAALLELEHVLGFQGPGVRGNLASLGERGVLFAAAAVGVIHPTREAAGAPAGRQRFLRGHGASVACIAACAEDPGLVATGEGGDAGVVIVWRLHGAAEPGPSAGQVAARLQGAHAGGVTALAFLGAERLVSVGAEITARSTVAVWEWGEADPLVALESGDGNRVLALAATPPMTEGQSLGGTSFVTVGVQHIRFWRVGARGTPLISRRGITGNKGRMQTLTCVSVLPPAVGGVLQLATGTEDGSVYVWRDRQLHLNLAGAHHGPVLDLVLCTSVDRAGSNILVSSGKDDSIHVWHVSPAVLTPGFDNPAVEDQSLEGRTTVASVKKLHLPSKLGAAVPLLAGGAGLGGVQSLAACEATPGWAGLLLGTGRGSLLHVELDVRDLKRAQGVKLMPHATRVLADAPFGGPVAGLCAHPRVPEVASVGAGGLDLWDTTSCKRAAHVELDAPGTCVAYSPALTMPHLAVGGSDGSVSIWDCSAIPGSAAHRARRVLAAPASAGAAVTGQVVVCRHRTAPVTAVRFSPDGARLAAASEDKVVDIYVAGSTGYHRVGVCKMHREAVAHLDWSRDGALLRSSDECHELLHWEVAGIVRGAVTQLPSGPRTADAHWASHSCTLTWGYQGLTAFLATPRHVRAVDCAQNGALAVAGDAYGGVRLVRFPCLDGEAVVGLGHAHLAHAAAIRDVRFLFDDSRVVSVAGDDQTLLVWRIPALDARPAPLVQRLSAALEAMPPAAPPLGEAAAAASQEASENDDFLGAAEEELATLRPYHANVHAPRLFSKGGEIVPFKEEAWMLAPPDHALELARVHGFRGHDRHRNVVYNSHGQAVLFSAGVASVVDAASGFQRFFARHTSDILCLALHPNGRVVATGQGGSSPRLFVWDSERCGPRGAAGAGVGQGLDLLAELEVSTVRALEAEGAVGGVQQLAFSACGRLIVAVLSDALHTVAVWDWRTRALLAQAPGDLKDVLAVACNPYLPPYGDGPGALVTCGVKHVLFWHMPRVAAGHPELALSSRPGELRGRAPLATMLCVAFTPEQTLCGAEDGRVYLFSHHGLLHRCVRLHAAPLTALCVHTEGTASVIFSADAAGFLKIFDKKFVKV